MVGINRANIQIIWNVIEYISISECVAVIPLRDSLGALKKVNTFIFLL